jgi:glycerol-3-phosphate acyltransferase PlsY
MHIFISILVAFILGSIPVDIWRGYRRFSLWLFLAEWLKGAIAVAFAWYYAGLLVAHFAALVVVLTHMYPFYSRYSRPGIWVAAGALLVLSPILTLVAVAIFFLSLFFCRQTRLAYILAIIGFFLLAILLSVHLSIWVLCFLLAAFIGSRSYVKGWQSR